MWIWISCVTYISESQIINLTIRLKHVAVPYKVTGQLITHIWHPPSVHFGPIVWHAVIVPTRFVVEELTPDSLSDLLLFCSQPGSFHIREHSGKLLKHCHRTRTWQFCASKTFPFCHLKVRILQKNVKYSIRIIIACWALFGRDGLVVFVLLVLSWCLWFCCAVSQPPQRKYNPLRCPLRPKDGSHYSVGMSAVHHTVTLTHTQLLAAHTNHICSHTFEQTCAQT